MKRLLASEEEYSAEYLIEHQNEVNWQALFRKDVINEDCLKQLLTSVKNEKFWCEIYILQYNNGDKIFPLFTVPVLIAHQDYIKWYHYFDFVQKHNIQLTNDEVKQLCDNIDSLCTDFWNHNESIMNKELYVQYSDKFELPTLICRYGFAYGWDKESIIKFIDMLGIQFLNVLMPRGHFNIPTGLFIKYQDVLSWHVFFQECPYQGNIILELTTKITSDKFWDELNFARICGDVVKYMSADLFFAHVDALSRHLNSFLERDLSEDDVRNVIDTFGTRDVIHSFSMNKKYSKLLTKEQLVEYEDDIVWNAYLTCNDPSEEDMYYYMDNISNSDFWEEISGSPYVTIEIAIEHSEDISWWDYFKSHKDLTVKDINYLLDNVDNYDGFIDNLLESNYLQYIDANRILDLYESYCIEWEEYLTDNVKLTGEDVEKLTARVNDDDFWEHIIYYMNVEELIKYQDKFEWDEIDLDDLEQLSSQDRRYLIATIPELKYNNAIDISDDWSEIKDAPRGDLYTMNTDLHGERKGAFVIVQVGKNKPCDVKITPDGSHNEMLIELHEEKGYPEEVFAYLTRIEQNGVAISGKLDIEADEEFDNEYDEANLRCAFGYIHVDEQEENPIAVVDADRIQNYSARQVRDILMQYDFVGEPFIAVGITNGAVNGSAFVKANKYFPKRLIKSYTPF